MLDMLNTILLIVNIALTVIVALIVVLKALKGAKRGAYLAPIHLGTVLLSAIAAFILTGVFTGMILSYLSDMPLEETLHNIETMIGQSLGEEIHSFVEGFDPAVISYIVAIPSALLSPLIFFLLYVLFRILFGAIRGVVIKACAIPKRTDVTGKTIGGVIGGLEGVLVVVLCLIPITSFLNIGTSVTQKISFEDKTVAEVIDSVEDFNEAPVFGLIRSMGGELLTYELTSVTLNDKRVNLMNEIEVGFEIYNNVMIIIDGSGDGFVVTEEKQTAISAVVEMIESSDYLPMVLSSAMHMVSDGFLGDIPENPTEPMDRVMAALGEFIESTTPETITADLRTFVDVFFLLNENGVMDTLTSGDTEAIMEAISAKDEAGDTVIKKLIRTLGSNPHTQTIIAALNELSVSIMCDSLGFTGDTTQVYEDLKQGLNDIIAITPPADKSDEEAVKAYKEELKTTLKDTITGSLENVASTEELNSIKEQLTDEVMDEMTDQVSNYLEQNPQIQEMEDEDVTEIILTYYDAYLQYQQDGTLPDDLPFPLPGGGAGGEGGDSVIPLPEGGGSDDSAPFLPIPDGEGGSYAPYPDPDARPIN